MAGEHAGSCGLAEPALQQGLHRSAGAGVERGGAFVEQQQHRLQLQGPEQVQHLLLTSRELLRIPGEKVARATQCFQPGHDCGSLPVGVVAMLAPLQWQAQIVFHRSRGHGAALRHQHHHGAPLRHAQLSGAGATAAEVTATQGIELSQGAQQQCFACTGWGDKAEPIALVQIEADLLPAGPTGLDRFQCTGGKQRRAGGTAVLPVMMVVDDVIQRMVAYHSRLETRSMIQDLVVEAMNKHDHDVDE